MRATSSVVDAALFLLLVGAAVATLALGGVTTGSLATGTAADAADTLGTSTATIEYSLAPGATHARSSVVEFPVESGPAFARTAHGTLAHHLAAAALGNLSINGQRVSRAKADYERAVANATGNLTRTREGFVHVRAVWEPYAGVPIRATTSVGVRPPRATAVHASALSVASGLPEVSDRAGEVAASGTYSDVAAVIAEAVVAGLFPPDRTRAALLGDYPVAELVTYRYERFGRLLGVNVTAAAVANDARRANERLRERLGDWFAADMRHRFETPAAAADAVSVGSVRLTVRTWSP